MSALDRLLDELGLDDADVLTVRTVRRLAARAEAAGGPEIVTTHRAAELLGRSADWWQNAARTGRVPGAWQDADGAPWNLPLAECRAYLARLQMQRSSQRGRRRGPREKAA